jgi:hypothetical protein
MLNRDKHTFNNLNSYKSTLKSSNHLLINFSNFNNFEIFVKKSTELMQNNKFNIPLDNILLEVYGIKSQNPATGKHEKQDLTLHLLPIQMATDVSTFNIMLVQEMRQICKDIYTRSHIVTLSQDGILMMPSIDNATVEIGQPKCYLKNIFTQKSIFSHIQSFTPGFREDVGYALNACTESVYCKTLTDMSRDVCGIAIASLMYASLPCHKFVKISNADRYDELKNMAKFELFDDNKWNNMLQNKSVGLHLQNPDFEQLSQASFSGVHTKGNVKYEVL